jgi:hypothetical protein
MSETQVAHGRTIAVIGLGLCHCSGMVAALLLMSKPGSTEQRSPMVWNYGGCDLG